MIILNLDDSTIKNLSTNELAVLRYVYDHTSEVSNMSIQELAKKISYSTSTILRFCKKLGFSGFSEFKYALRSEIQTSDVPKISLPNKRSSKMIINSLCSDIEATSHLLMEGRLDAAIRYLNSDIPIYLWSPGGLTSVLIDYLEMLLFASGRQNVHKIETPKTANHVISNLGPDNILFVISSTGAYAPTVKLVKLANMNHIPVISITPYTNNTIANLSSVNFCFFANQRENNGAEYTSRLPIFYTISMIIKCYLKSKEPGGPL